ncbi:MAG: Mu-like prophage protein GP16 [Methylocystaceae bacterium]|nr:MAG: Mu-like prophage protein GP16 [Methylocystaceae bacterium]KAF0213979.1 MAG: Mu-like prophage protein [Methylocystaceae bacterium]TXT46884.1 MAG: Mu-like prophage protein GP16 [Methylocystaceae bacterium]
MTTTAQTRAIHTLLRQIPHYTDDDYRALLKREFRGVSSSSHLSQVQAAKLIEILKVLAGQHPEVKRGNASRRAAETVTGPYGAKLQALWISAFNLGIVDNRDDRALIAFIERQTKIAHPRWLTEHKDAKKAIEALKDWIAREAHVDWPSESQALKRGMDVSIASKQAVIAAQAARLADVEPFNLDDFVNGYIISNKISGFSIGALSDRHLDGVIATLGSRLRKRAKAKKEAA